MDYEVVDEALIIVERTRWVGWRLVALRASREPGLRIFDAERDVAVVRSSGGNAQHVRNGRAHGSWRNVCVSREVAG